MLFLNQQACDDFAAWAAEADKMTSKITTISTEKQSGAWLPTDNGGSFALVERAPGQHKPYVALHTNLTDPVPTAITLDETTGEPMLQLNTKPNPTILPVSKVIALIELAKSISESAE